MTAAPSPATRRASLRSRRRWLPTLLTVAVVATSFWRPVAAVHESTNTLVFAPGPASAAPTAAGNGRIDYRGGTEPQSQWTATFAFVGLAPAATYTVVVRGRAGDDGSPAADAFTPICAFATDGAGAGGCWFYLVGLRRVGVVQLRLGAEGGAPVLQATRAAGGPGSIVSLPNRFSPSPVASPAASPGSVRPASGTPGPPGA